MYNWNISSLGAFIIPNKPIRGDTSLTKYQVQLSELENHLGTKLMPQLSPEKVQLARKDYCIIKINNGIASVKIYAFLMDVK